MEGLLFPIIMLAITFIGSGLFFLIQKQKKPKIQTGEETSAIQTAQEFIHVKDIKENYLYTTSGFVFAYVRIHSISMDLYSKAEKHLFIRQLTAELSDIPYPFKFLAVSRPVDISFVITEMQSMLKNADDKRKELLRQEILQMSGYALSGEIVERQFYVSFWEKIGEEGEKEVGKRAALFSEKFSGCGISCDVLGEKEIVRLMNLIHNPSYIHLEDTEVSASIPFLKEDSYA